MWSETSLYFESAHTRYQLESNRFSSLHQHSSVRILLSILFRFLFLMNCLKCKMWWLLSDQREMRRYWNTWSKVVQSWRYHIRRWQSASLSREVDKCTKSYRMRVSMSMANRWRLSKGEQELCKESVLVWMRMSRRIGLWCIPRIRQGIVQLQMSQGQIFEVWTNMSDERFHLEWWILQVSLFDLNLPLSTINFTNVFFSLIFRCEVSKLTVRSNP